MMPNSASTVSRRLSISTRHALARLHAERGEAVRDPRRGIREFLPGQRDRAVDERRPAGEPAAVLRDQIRHQRAWALRTTT